jgi:hypothetical protein
MVMEVCHWLANAVDCRTSEEWNQQKKLEALPPVCGSGSGCLLKKKLINNNGRQILMQIFISKNE